MTRLTWGIVSPTSLPMVSTSRRKCRSDSESGLTFMLRPRRSRGPEFHQLIRREDPVDIENHQETGIALTHSLYEVGLDRRPEFRSRFDLIGLEVNHLLHRIRQRADDRG